METLHQLKEFIDPSNLIRLFGYPGLTLIVFLETGAMVFFLPGDSLLFMAGLFAGNGDLNLLALWGLLIPAAIVGDAVSYFIGSKMGPALFNKPESRFFKPQHMKAASEFTKSTAARRSSWRASCPSFAPSCPWWPASGRCPTAASWPSTPSEGPCG